MNIDIKKYHECMLEIFDQFCGYFENVNNFAVGWTISLVSEVVFFIMNLLWFKHDFLYGGMFSILSDVLCGSLSCVAAYTLITNKNLMNTDAYKFVLRSTPEYGLSKIVVVVVISIMTFLFGTSSDGFIMFLLSLGYVIGFYTMIANPKPPYRKAYMFSK